MSFSAVVLSNSNILKYILTFLDPRYEEFQAKPKSGLSLNYACKCDYAFVILQTFQCLHEEMYLKRVVLESRKCIRISVELLSSRNKFIISYSLCKWSIEMEILNTGEHICSLGCKWDNLPVLQQLVRYKFRRWRPSLKDVVNTVRNGNVDQLEWLNAKSVGVSELLHRDHTYHYGGQCTCLCSLAAGNGHLDLLQWLRSQNPPCPWDNYTCSGAASIGHLNVLAWLRSQDPPCPWDENACYVAAKNGHLHVLQWLRSKNPPCPWDEDAVRNIAGLSGHSNIIQWL